MRAKINREEEADNLYLACDTPLTRKLVASNKVNMIVRKTKPDILINELERIYLPKLSVVVEQQQLCHLEQVEDETINNFESRVRKNAMALYRLNTCPSK